MRYGWALNTVIDTAWRTSANANKVAGHGTASEGAPSIYWMMHHLCLWRVPHGIGSTGCNGNGMMIFEMQALASTCGVKPRQKVAQEGRLARLVDAA